MNNIIKIFLTFLSLSTLSLASLPQDSLLSPFDFGLSLNGQGEIDKCSLPANIVIGIFDGNHYPDIARFIANRVEIYFRQGNYFPIKPSLIKYFEKSILSIHMEGEIWNNWWDIVVELSDGKKERIKNSPQGLIVEPLKNQCTKYAPAPRVKELDFETVWQSEGRPWGMHVVAVGELDNDGIIELVTYYKEVQWADTAYILIYKSIGDDEYELYMQERFNTYTSEPYLTSLTIADIDSNGFKELIYTADQAYFWEFSSPGNYTSYCGSIIFFRGVIDSKVTDVNHNGIPELSYLTVCDYLTPPCIYEVQEYFGRLPTNYYFSTLASIYQEWSDYSFDIGDFDNDGTVDMVSGNFGFVWSFDPVPIQFYRYDTTALMNFSQNFLNTGVASSCATPVIADYDDDGLNELYAGGLHYGGGSAFIYKGNGLGIGEVVWRDTTTMVMGPNESHCGYIDYQSIAVSLMIWGGAYNNTTIYLIGCENTQYGFIWESSQIDSTLCSNPCIIDIDFDNKTNIILGVNGFGSAPNYIMDMEEVGSFVSFGNEDYYDADFELNSVYPNPFNINLSISFSLSKNSPISLKIFNIDGQQVYNYSEDTVFKGEYRILWEANVQSSGIYFIELSNGIGRKYAKVALLK